MTMKYTQKAIELAIEGGYRKNSTFPYREKYGVKINIHRVLLDPLFWQALEKAEDWKEIEIVMDDHRVHLFMGGTLERQFADGWDMIYKAPAWKYHMLRCMEHLADGHDVDSYFEGLLAKNKV